MLTFSRKHTGERPFQCHCSRRFSRLDNLRQHAQTVHVNEDIPGDSLAATSTRFQRQIRTDRVRPPGSGRPRSNTMTSQGGSHGRGHSRNLSASSIGSTASSMGIPEDLRRRPPPLAMANDPNKRGMMSVDTYNPVTGSPSQQYAYFPQSPSGFSTPTSTTFSTGPASPGFTSPPSSISRSSFYNGARHGRRLSVPSGANPYQSNPYPPSYYSPMPSAANPAYSQQSSVYASPTSSVFSHGRRDSETELEFRRRTWHSGTYPGYTQRPATSGLMYGQTPDEPRPAMSQQSAASQVTRLPGIESFDHAPPSAARAAASSPMMIESEPRPRSSGRPSDAGLHQNLTRLDITSANAPPPDGQWQTSHVAPLHHGYFIQQSGGMPPQIVQAPPQPLHEQPSTPRRTKRQAWYGGPVGPVTFGRPSPEDSGSSDGVPTPLTQQGGEYHPEIISQNEQYPAHPPAAVPVNGPDNQYKVQHTSYPRSSVQQHPQQDKPEPIRADSGFQSFAPVPVHMQAAQQHTYALQAGHDPRFASGYMQAPNHPEQRNDMGRLEALVAVATSENRVVENRN
jgi:hypothetical protein